jgi:hypothetical protein
MYQLFALFMITDPVTTVSSKKGEVGVTILIALAEFGLRLAEFIAAPFYALFLVGPAAMLVEMYWFNDEEDVADDEAVEVGGDGEPVEGAEAATAPEPAS